MRNMHFIPKRGKKKEEEEEEEEDDIIECDRCQKLLIY